MRGTRIGIAATVHGVTYVWDVPVGALVTRAAVRAKAGGGSQGGILPSATTPNVLVYSDPVIGETFGYTYDGWTEDMSTYLYTGAGQNGPQVMTSGNNRSIRDHRQDQRALRLFVAEGTVPGSGTKTHRYLGEFEVDPDLPYTEEPAPDAEGKPRTVIVYRLRPSSEQVLRRDVDRSRAVQRRTSPLIESIPAEAHNAPTFESSGTGPRTARRVESALVERFTASLAAHALRRWRIVPPGDLKPLYTDIYDETANELFEAKGSVDRRAVREGIGQLFDYRRFLDEQKPALTLLLPRKPPADLVDLLHGLGISCVFEEIEGMFTRLSASMPAK